MPQDMYARPSELPLGRLHPLTFDVGAESTRSESVPRPSSSPIATSAETLHSAQVRALAPEATRHGLRSGAEPAPPLAGTILQPGCTLLAVAGPIVLGENNIVEDNVVIVNRHRAPMVIGDNNLFEVGCRMSRRPQRPSLPCSR